MKVFNMSYFPSDPEMASVNFIKYILAFMLCGLCSVSRAASQNVLPAVIHGLVVDTDDAPVAYANVQLVGTTDGASTRQDGRFEFITKQTGIQELLVKVLGFESVQEQLSVVAGDSVFTRIVLRQTVTRLDQLVITSSGYSTGESEGATIQSLDVVTTAGAAADIFLAIQTLPGTSMVDEGAGLFIRGGDLNETLIILDQATLSHPYKFESPTGGFFGIIPPFMIQETAFATGGFSARYGNVLSGVLDMNSMGMPSHQSYTLNFGLAAASLGLNIPFASDKLGIRFTGNRSFTETLFRINGQLDQFSDAPQSSDLNLSLMYDYSSTGNVKIYSFLADNHLGVHVNLPTSNGIFKGRTSTSLFNILWTDIIRDWYIQTSFSLNRYSAEQQLIDLNMKPMDTIYKFRSDAEHYIGIRTHIRLGVEVERTSSHFMGLFPSHEDITTPTENYLTIDEVYGANRIGSYTEFMIKLTRRIVLIPSIRGDYHSLSKFLVIDPRGSFRYVFSKATNAHLSWGIYHQFASPFEYNPTTGNSRLNPQYSQHYILGMNHESGTLHIRIEGYYKPYSNLILRHMELNYTNDGKGRAIGFDIFAKYGAFLQTRINGWGSYSFNRSERIQARSIGNELVYERARTPFEIRHNLTIVAKGRLFNSLYGGLTMRYASGRPITPIVSSILSEEGDYYLPIEGPVGAERLPHFQRMDIQLSYYLPFGQENSLNFYVALSNALNRANVTGYEYSADYSERKARISNYRRFFYCGVAVSFNR